MGMEMGMGMGSGGSAGMCINLASVFAEAAAPIKL